MVRAQVSIQIPEEYKQNEMWGLCRVCGKTRDKFEKGRRKHCSEKCADKYQECFMYWDSFRAKVINKNPQCRICKSKERLEVDHIEPVAITGIVFDEKNVQVLCYSCHKKKTKKDLKKIKNHRNNQKELFVKERKSEGEK